MRKLTRRRQAPSGHSDVGLEHLVKADSDEKKAKGDALVWVASQAIDYVCCGCMCYSQVFRDFYSASPLRLAWILISQALIAVAILYLRESCHFWLLGGRVPAVKRQPLSRETWKCVAKTALSAQSSFFWMVQFHLIDAPPAPGFSADVDAWEFWKTAYIQFYVMILVRDVFSLAPFHHLLHTRRFYHLHKKHHQVREDAQAMHAFHIDGLDLMLENTGAPLLLLLGQHCMGYSVGMHYFAAAMLSCHDGALHSVNPYSSMYFMPLLDHLLKPTIYHQLHHAVPHIDGGNYLLFVPYHHIFASKRKQDANKYNKIFGTDFCIR